jgi:hypothetical protein
VHVGVLVIDAVGAGAGLVALGIGDVSVALGIGAVCVALGAGGASVALGDGMASTVRRGSPPQALRTMPSTSEHGALHQT